MDRHRKLSRRRAVGLACRLSLAAGLASVGCSTLSPRAPSLLPTSHQLKSGPFVLYSNEPVKPDAPAVLALDQLRTDLAARMNYDQAGDRGPIEVYVLDDREAFLHLLRFYFPELPPRRAFFLAQDDQRIVYTYQGPMLEEDLRHEAAHALLRGRFGDVPLWLDEGLAEYFEAGPDDLQDRGDRLARLSSDVATGWKPDLKRLEALDEVHHMGPRDYRESWAWVDLMLSDRRDGTPALLTFLQTPEASRLPLSEALAARGTDAGALIAHIGGEPASGVVARKPAIDDPRTDRVVRMQDRAEPDRAVVEPRRPGLFRRIGAFLGL